MRLLQVSARRACALVIASVMAGCGETEETTPAPEEKIFDLTTGAIPVPGGAERYMCYAQTLDRDLVVDRFEYEQTATVHHLLLAKTTTPEPDGVAECDVLFRTSWIPLFGSGNGTAVLDAPAGNGHMLPKGTQLLVQLHLLNSEAADASTNVTVHMREVEKGDVSPVTLYAFGTNDITVPASQPGTVTNDCEVESDVQIFAWWPHMHRFGKSLTLLVGPDEDSLEEVYRVDPWDFDNQRVEAIPLTIPAGSMSRIECTYENPGSEDLTFGESSNDEMCFLPTFVTGGASEVDGCVYLKPVGDEPVPPDPAAGVCGEHEPSPVGIGSVCTKGGGECAQGQTCTSDQGDASPGMCIKIGGCDVTADCGGGWGTCCAPKEAGGLLNICIHEACRPDDCIPQ